MPTDPSVRSRLDSAFEAMAAAAAENAERSRLLEQRAEHYRRELAAGATTGDLVAAEETPRIAELLTMNMATLETAGATLRRTLAQALRDEGHTLEAIAGLFGVTRQRISALLRSPNA